MKQRTKALLAGVISGAAFAGLVGGLILWLPSYKQKKEVEAIKPVETAAPIIKEPEATPDPATEEAAQRTKYADLIARNPDFAGWIEIPGVDIDLPILRRANAADYRVQLNELKIGIAAGANDPQLGRNPLLPRSIRLSAWLTLHMPRLWQWACRNFLKDRQ